jgi:glycosyltransferase involved in cell wall biosynthesis
VLGKQDNLTLLSILVPTFNQKQALTLTLASLVQLSKTRGWATRFEVIVSNNASTDGTNALAKYAPNRSLSWFDQQVNLGFFGNIEFLSRQARGKYLLFIGSGETINLEYFSGFLRLLEERDWDLGTLGLAYFDETAASTQYPNRSRLTKLKTHFAPRPIYTEALAGNVYARNRFLLGLQEYYISGDYWPHVEISVFIAEKRGHLNILRYTNPVVTIHGSEDGWWRSEEQWRLVFWHLLALRSSDGSTFRFSLWVKKVELSTLGLYRALSQSRSIASAPVVINKHEIDKFLGSNMLPRVTLQLLFLRNIAKLRCD